MAAKGFVYPHQRLKVWEEWAWKFEKQICDKLCGEGELVDIYFGSEQVCLCIFSSCTTLQFKIAKKKFTNIIFECLAEERNKNETVS